MKKGNMILVFLLALWLWPLSSHAQGPGKAISVDVFLPLMSPVSFLYGETMYFVPLNIKYQQVIADHLVLMLKGGLNYSWDKRNTSDRSVDVYPLAGVDWHPFHAGLEGFYAGLSGFFNYSAHYYNTRVDYRNYRTALGCTLGWQFLLRSGIIIDLTFGLGYGYNVDVDSKGAKKTGYSVDETIAGVFVGFCF